MDDKLAIEQLKRHDSLMSKYRSVFATDHQTLSQYFLPNQSDINVEKTESISSWTQDIYDTTGVQAAQTLAAGQFSMFTPPNQPWAEYGVPDALKAKDEESENQAEDEATKFLGRASARVMRELGRSNFYSMKGMADLGLAVFGTDAMIFDAYEDSPEIFNFVHCKVGTYSIEENYRGIVDTLRREIKMTIRQVKQMFNKPDDEIPEEMERAAKGDGNSREFKILHCIFPREDSKRLPGAKDAKNKPIASVYLSIEFKKVIRVSGYDESPLLVRRFARWGTDSVWGYGPAYLAIPDARQVNYVQQYLDALAELHAYPRVLTPDNLEGDVDLRAGGITTWDSNNAQAKPEEWMTAGDYKLGIEMQQARRQAIRDAFYVDAFKLLNSQPLLDKEMTAYEIAQRQAEQLQGVAPAFTRNVPEFINPLMIRAFGIMYRAGKLGRAPDGLFTDLGQGKKALARPEVVVTSRFNDALKALKNRAAEEVVKFILPISEQKPEAWDVLNLDNTLVNYAKNAGMAPDDIRSRKGKDSIEAIRQARAKLQQQQMAAQMAETLGKAGKGLGGSPEFIQQGVKQQMEGAA